MSSTITIHTHQLLLAVAHLVEDTTQDEVHALMLPATCHRVPGICHRLPGTCRSTYYVEAHTSVYN
jgi:hypothetical protein